MQTQQSDTFNGTADQTNKLNSNLDDPKQLLQQIPIADSPFTAVKLENKWFLTMGKYRISEPVETLEQLQDEVTNTTWNRIMQVIQIMIEENNKNNGNPTNTK